MYWCCTGETQGNNQVLRSEEASFPSLVRTIVEEASSADDHEVNEPPGTLQQFELI